jgi:hypothetical protein
MRVPACTAPREPEGGRKEGTSSSRRRDQKGKQSTRWASDPRNPWAERGISTINDAKEAPLSQNALGAVDCARQKERAQRHNGPLSLFHRQTIWLPANGTATRSSLPLSNPRRMHPGCGCVSLREHRAPQTVRRRCNAACDARGHCCCRHHDGHCHRAMRIHRVHHVHHGCCQSAVSYGNTRTPRQKIQNQARVSHHRQRRRFRACSCARLTFPRSSSDMSRDDMTGVQRGGAEERTHKLTHEQRNKQTADKHRELRRRVQAHAAQHRKDISAKEGYHVKHNGLLLHCLWCGFRGNEKRLQKLEKELFRLRIANLVKGCEGTRAVQ